MSVAQESNAPADITPSLTDLEKAQIRAGVRKPKLLQRKTVSGLIIEVAFGLVIATMMLSMGAAFCVKFLRWALW